MDLQYMDEEERESKFNKQTILKGFIILCIIGGIGAAIFFFGSSIWKKKTVEATEEKAASKVETELGFSTEHFIIDDSKEKENKMEVAEPVPQKESVKEMFLSQKGNRICEFDCIDLPGITERGDLIDVRLSLADGRNYTVLSGKKVGDYYVKESREIVWLSLNEVEILTLESALSDLELFSKAKLYAVILENSKEEGGSINYPVNGKSKQLIKAAMKKNADFRKWKPLDDETLNKDRMKHLEGKKEEGWREAATYWNEE